MKTAGAPVPLAQPLAARRQGYAADCASNLKVELGRLADTVDGPDVDRALQLARRASALVPTPGARLGATRQRWNFLRQVSARDLSTARILEAHLDGVAILAEAQADGRDVPAIAADSTWGVFAAEGLGTKVFARQTVHGDWRLDGVKPWCSLAGRLSHALVTAHTDGGRALFAVVLDDTHVEVDDASWSARGLVEVPSGPVTFTDVPAHPVGPVGWYLHRPGFAYGGMGVAACWYGGARGIADTVLDRTRSRGSDQIALWHLGELDADLHAARTVLHAAADAVDAGRATGAAGRRLAHQVRAVIADAAERVLARAGHACGPAPLADDADHARRVADLTLYLRQHHAERDLADLGALVLDDTR